MFVIVAAPIRAYFNLTTYKIKYFNNISIYIFFRYFYLQYLPVEPSFLIIYLFWYSTDLSIFFYKIYILFPMLIFGLISFYLRFHLL